MLIRIREGAYDPAAPDEALEPKGRELWSSNVEDLTAAAFHAAGIRVEPGTWYSAEEFKRLVATAETAHEPGVFSAVETRQPGVGKEWVATIEVRESSAALMICNSVIEHMDRLINGQLVWIWIE